MSTFNAREETISCKTSVESYSTIFNWEIEKFGLICPNPYAPSHTYLSTAMKKKFYSCFNGVKSSEQKIKFNNEFEVEWFMHLQFTMGGSYPEINPEENYISLYMKFKDYIGEELGVDFSFSFIGKTLEGFKRSRVTTSRQSIDLGWLDFVSVKTLWDQGAKYLSDDTLHVRVNMTIFRQPRSENSSSFTSLSLNWATDELINDMEHLLNSHKDSDITVYCGDRTFLIHSSIIKARNPVLQLMLDSGLSESINKTIKIDDVDPIDFETFLQYLYTSRIKISNDDLSRLIGLVRVADKYEALKLKFFCFEQICKLISIENAGEIAVLAYLHSAPNEFTKQIMDFCFKNWPVLYKNRNFQTCFEQNLAAFLEDDSSTQA